MFHPTSAFILNLFEDFLKPFLSRNCSVTQFLREIKVGKCRVSKSNILSYLGALKSGFWDFALFEGWNSLDSFAKFREINWYAIKKICQVMVKEVNFTKFSIQYREKVITTVVFHFNGKITRNGRFLI